MKRKPVPLAWAVVTVLGIIVVILVVSWQLFPRLTSAQSLVDDLSPAFTVDRVLGTRGGIEVVKAATNTADNMMPGNANAELPKLVDLVAQRTGKTHDEAAALLQSDYTYIYSFLQSLPLTGVTDEIPKIVHYIGTVLYMTSDEVENMLKNDYPLIHQVINAVPPLTNGWYSIPGTEKLTTFDGEPVRTMPQLATYFSDELVAPVERQQANFRPLGIRGGVGFLAPLLLALGIIVILFGTTMVVLTWRGVPRNVTSKAWVVVSVVGVAIVGLVFGLNLFPRLIGGQHLLDDTRPMFSLDRIQGDRAGIEYINHFVNALGPAVPPDGGLIEEYDKLLKQLADSVGVPVADVRALVELDFPHTAKLLDGTPFSAAAADSVRLVEYLASASNVSVDEMWKTVQTELPHTYTLFKNIKIVTDSWYVVPGAEKLTRFDGQPASAVPVIRDYFRDDVIPGLERQQKGYVIVDSNWPPLFVFAPLLTAVGLFVVGYGFFLRSVTAKQLARQDLAEHPPVAQADPGVLVP